MNPLLRISRLIFPLAVLALFTYCASAFYDPRLARWINRDPIAEPGFEARAVRHAALDTTAQVKMRLAEASMVLDAPNSYTFVRNDPVQSMDSHGLCTMVGFVAATCTATCTGTCCFGLFGCRWSWNFWIWEVEVILGIPCPGWYCACP